MTARLLPLLLLAACGAPAPATSGDACAGVACAANERIDPLTCRCMCGDPVLALACGVNETCTLRHGLFRCERVPCTGVSCDRGMHCDPVTEACVCGSLPPVVCADFQTCELERCLPATRCEGVTCGERGACDESDGLCRCGGALCDATERCVDGACSFQPCLGVNCPDGSVCNVDDSLCHCGGEVGPVCAAGQVCREGACEP